jgi:hypothetical protein
MPGVSVYKQYGMNRTQLTVANLYTMMPIPTAHTHTHTHTHTQSAVLATPNFSRVNKNNLFCTVSYTAVINYSAHNVCVDLGGGAFPRMLSVPLRIPSRGKNVCLLEIPITRAEESYPGVWMCHRVK